MPAVAEAFRQRVVRTIVFAPDGALWVGCTDGLARVDLATGEEKSSRSRCAAAQAGGWRSRVPGGPGLQLDLLCAVAGTGPVRVSGQVRADFLGQGTRQARRWTLHVCLPTLHFIDPLGHRLLRAVPARSRSGPTSPESLSPCAKRPP